MITCKNCKTILDKYLCDLPKNWRDQIVTSICDALCINQSIDCEAVRDCETLTSLSSFTVNNNQVCITYKDENKVSFTRCFDFDEILNNSLDGVDPKCITDQDTWNSMTYKERIQAIIDYACSCEEITTSTTTTTTIP